MTTRMTTARSTTEMTNDEHAHITTHSWTWTGGGGGTKQQAGRQSGTRKEEQVGIV